MKKIFLFTLILILYSSCKKHHKCNDPSNPDCQNYDPCYGKIITGDFTMNQYTGKFVNPNAQKPEFCDTILLNGVSMNALMRDANSYTWKVGSDTRIFTGSTLELLFDNYRKDTNNLNPQNKNYYNPIAITLTVKNQLKGCIQAKDTFFTITRDLVFAVESPWLGKFKGISDHDGKERIIEIGRYFIPNNPNGSKTFFKNLPNLLDKDSVIMYKVPSDILNSFKYTWWDFKRDDIIIDWTSSEIIKPRPYDGMNMGKIYIDPQQNGRDFICFEYKYVTDDNRIKFYKFKGRREP